MPDVVVLLLAASATALATGLGAIPVFLFGRRTVRFTPALLGFAAGVMGVAAFAGLLVPAFEEGSVGEVAAGLGVGVAFLVVVRSRFDADAGFMGRSGPGARTSALVFLVLLVHSLPEGFAVGTAFASDRAGLSLFVIVAIAIQNIPEGTSVAIPMQEAGFGAARQFWTAVGTSAPQPVGALVAYLAKR
jgi:ZIP family zinc transporter